LVREYIRHKSAELFLPTEAAQCLESCHTGKIIADNLSKAGWSWGCFSAVDSNGRTIWIADAHRGDGKRFVVRAGEKLTVFLELESQLVVKRMAF
jgi:hypothetical protein